MMHTGQLAERTGLSLRTIRHYDDIGLFAPSGRSEGGFRLYTEGDFERLMLIRRMKPLGYSLEQMGDLLRAIDAAANQSVAAADAQHMLQDFLQDAQERREKLVRQIGMADEFLALLQARLG